MIENVPLTPEEQSDEFLLMGLRLREGIDVARYQALSGKTLRRHQIDELAADGFISEDAFGRLRVTPDGHAAARYDRRGSGGVTGGDRVGANGAGTPRARPLRRAPTRSR